MAFEVAHSAVGRNHDVGFMGADKRISLTARLLLIYRLLVFASVCAQKAVQIGQQPALPAQRKNLTGCIDILLHHGARCQDAGPDRVGCGWQCSLQLPGACGGRRALLCASVRGSAQCCHGWCVQHGRTADDGTGEAKSGWLDRQSGYGMHAVYFYTLAYG